VKIKINLIGLKYNQNDICPSCKQRTMWEGYCSSCGYGESTSEMDWSN